VDGWGRASEMALQWVAARHVRGGRSPELGVAHATGHRFRWGLALWDQCDTTNSPRVVLDGGVTGGGHAMTASLIQASVTVKSSRQRLSSTNNHLNSFSSSPKPCGFNCFGQWWIHREQRALGFVSCGSIYGEKKPLFIGLLVWTRRGLRVLQFLCINRTLIRLCL
jgi:hypothetical protein